MSKKARRKPSAKQLAWRKKFISRFVRGGTKKRRKRASVSRAAESPSAGVSQMAKTKRRRRGYSGSRRSRRSGGGGGVRMGRGFIPTDAVSLLGGGVVGAIGSELVLSKIPLDFVKSGYGRILAKFVVGTAAWYLLRRMAPKIGLGIFAGAGIGAARDVAALLLSGGGGAATGVKGLVSPGAPYALPQGGSGEQLFMNQATGQYYRAG